MDKISVIVPVYNSVGYLVPTLTSIQQQTHTHLEIVVVDDGSTDSTLDLVASLQKEDDRIVVAALKNDGAPGHCRNHGYQIASSDYIIFFDSDDIMYPSMLEQMLDVMKKEKVDLVIGNARFVSMETKKSLPSKMEWFFEKKDPQLSDLFQISPFPCNKLYRKSFLQRSGVEYLCGVFAQDLGYFLSNLFYEPSFAIIPTFVMEYMVREGSITTSQKTRKKHIDIIPVFDQVFQTYEQTGSNPNFESGLMHMFIRSMLFKASFFDLLKESEYLDKIRAYLFRRCPNWYAREEFKAVFSTRKQWYNRLLLQYRGYFVIGMYKKIKLVVKKKA